MYLANSERGIVSLDILFFTLILAIYAFGLLCIFYINNSQNDRTIFINFLKNNVLLIVYLGLWKLLLYVYAVSETLYAAFLFIVHYALLMSYIFIFADWIDKTN